MHIRSISVKRKEDFERTEKKKGDHVRKIEHLIDFSITIIIPQQGQLFLFKKIFIEIEKHPLNFN